MNYARSSPDPAWTRFITAVRNTFYEQRACGRASDRICCVVLRLTLSLPTVSSNILVGTSGSAHV